MKFSVATKDIKLYAVSITLLVLLLATACYVEFFLYMPERLIEKKLNSYGIEFSDISLESWGYGWDRTYILSTPPTDPKANIVLAN